MGLRVAMALDLPKEGRHSCRFGQSAVEVKSFSLADMSEQSTPRGRCRYSVGTAGGFSAR